MATELGIANSALLKLGERTITSLAANNKPASTMNDRIADVKAAVLRAHPWGFATDRVTLDDSQTITGIVDNGSGLCRVTVAGHGYSTGDKVSISQVAGTAEANGTWRITVITVNTFDLQATTFNNTYISGGIVGLAAEFDWSWKIALPTDFVRLLYVNADNCRWRLEGGFILAQQSSIEIQYTKDADYADFDGMFTEAMACYLAWDTCYRITTNQSLKDQMLKDYEYVVRRARFVDATEESPDQIRADDWLDARVAGATQYVRDPMT